MATSTNGGSTASFSNAPQATGDLFASSSTGLTEDSTGIVYLDVMGNDLGGNAKSLWSLDNATSATVSGGTAPLDLVTQDAARTEALSADTSLSGAKIWITADGKVGYDAATLSADFKAQLQGLHAGQILTDTFTYAIRLGNGTLSWATANVEFAGANDAPTVTSALTDAAAEGSIAFSRNLLDGASDVDHGETATLSVSGVTYAVDGGAASATAPAGVSLSGSTLSVNPANAAFDHLAVGEHATIVVSYNVKDAQGATVAQTETITITGTNDVPTVTSALTDTAAEGSIAFSRNLLDGASDVDHGETATLSVSGVTYAVDGGAASATAPAGVSLSGSTLSVNPASAAFDHLAVGEHATIVVSYNVKDAQGATVAQTETITITGTNDAPVISLGAGDQDAAGIDETNAGLTAGGHLTASDVDTTDTVTLSVGSAAVNAGSTGATGLDAAALKAMFSVDADGTWHFNSGAEAFNSLATGQTLVLDYVVKADDGHGGADQHTVSITITGTNDAPVISLAAGDHDTTARDETNAGLTAGGHLTASDVDATDTVTLSVNSAAVNPASTGATGLDPAALKAMFSVDADGTWHFNSGAEAFNSLATGQTLVLDYVVKADDGHGGADQHTVSITITGANDAPVISLAGGDHDSAALTETNSGLTAGGHLTASDVDATDTVTLSVNSAAVNPASTGATALDAAALKQMFTVDADGTWHFNSGAEAFNSLATGQTLVLDYVVKADDAHGGADLHTVSITITGTNDAAVLSSDTQQLTETNAAADISTSGTLTISDVDSAETFVAQAGTVGSYGTFAIDSAGAWSYTAGSAHNEFVAGTTYTDTFSVASADGTLTSVTVKILGANDAAVLSSDTQQLTETNAAADISTSGTLTISDVDSAETFVAQAGTVGSYGTFAIDSAGAWSYTAGSAHNEFVAGTTYTDTFSVASADGTLTSVTVNILGANDAAVLSSDTQQLTETNAAADISTSGTLTISDVDSAETFVAQAGTVGSYGTFAIDSAGAWSYTAGSAHNEFVAGTTYTDTFSVASADGTLTSVTVKILGANDAPTVPVDNASPSGGSVAENAANGTLVGITAFSTDVDAGDAVAYSLTNNAGGRFAINATTGVVSVANGALLDYETNTSHTITVQASDGHGGVSSQNFVIGVGDVVEIPANSAPVANADTVIVSTGATPAFFAASALLKNDTDPDNDGLVFSGVTVNGQASGDVTYNSTTGLITLSKSNLDSFEYQVSDGHGHISTATVTVTHVDTSNGNGNPDSIDLSTMGSYAASYVDAQGGADTLAGGGGGNWFIGGAGADALKGGSEADTLVGGAANDILTGGAGADVFNYAALTDSLAAAPDTITDFTSGQDRISIGHAVSAISTVTRADSGTLAQNLTAALNSSNFAANNVAVVTITGGDDAGSYLVINNGAAAYQSASDAVIKVGAATFQTADFF